MSGRAWLKARDLAQKNNVSVSRVAQAVSELPLKNPTGQVLRINVIRQPGPITLDPKHIATFEKKARELMILSKSPSKEWVGLVLEAYLNDLVMSDEPLDVHQDTPTPTHDIYLSGDAWRGLKEMAGKQTVNKTLRELTEHRVQFHWQAPPRIPDVRRHPRRMSMTTQTIEYLWNEALRLGIRPPAPHGMISWASMLLELWGRGLVAPGNYLEAVARNSELAEAV